MLRITIYRKKISEFPIKNINSKWVCTRPVEKKYMNHNKLRLNGHQTLLQLTYDASPLKYDTLTNRLNEYLDDKNTHLVTLLKESIKSKHDIKQCFVKFNEDGFDMDSENELNQTFGFYQTDQSYEAFVKETLEMIAYEELEKELKEIEIRLADRTRITFMQNGLILISTPDKKANELELLNTVADFTHVLSKDRGFSPVELIEKKIIMHPFSRLHKLIDHVEQLEEQNSLPEDVQSVYTESKEELKRLSKKYKDKEIYE